MLRTIPFTLLLLAAAASAGPYISAGGTAVRQDIQLLADHGVLTGPVSTWPLAWGPILRDLDRVDGTSVPPEVVEAVSRLRQRAAWETRTSELQFNARLGLAEKPATIRSFEDTPRGSVDAQLGASWTGNLFNAQINVQGVDSDQDDDEFRYDNSMLGVVAGNWSFSANTLQRWWGPGWDGSLILSDNGRPFPALTIDRVFTDPFETKWLSWLGPWDLTVMFGLLEEERAVPNAQFFGMRFAFRPLPSLEIGLSRGAQWCGDDRPCDFDTFIDLLIGRDNRGDEGIDTENEPGNQLAGFDVRWATRLFGVPMAFYSQMIGEDEAGGLPSRYIGQLGVEVTGRVFDRWSTHTFAEFAGTSCQFYESSEIFNCAYNHGIYRTGYRYRGRTIGHGADNDARFLSAGISALDANERQWRLLLRYGKLNRGGAPDSANSLTPTPLDIASIDLAHGRPMPYGYLDIGVGFETVDDPASGETSDDVRAYVQWRTSY